MKELKLLIVEDDDNVIRGYMSNIESYNKTNHKIKIIPLIENNKDEAINHLRNSDNNFDGAIIDLDLKKSGGDDSSGNEVIKEVKTNLRFPVFVISGTAHNIAEELNEETAFFKVRNRDDNFDFVEEMVSIYNTGITNITNRKGTIEKYISEIFWKHLSNSMELWVQDESRTSEEKENSLIRYTLLHIQEYIDEELEKYHPSEFYITKPIKKNIITGDIINYNNTDYIILTPSCDIVLRNDGTRNADFILICKIKPLESIVKNYNLLNKDTSTSNDNRKRLITFLENKNQKYHFVPKSNMLEAGLIDFQDKTTIPTSSFNNLLTEGLIIRKATVSQPFLKDIISRYSNYFARQGSPDFNSDEIYNSLFENKQNQP